MEGCVHVSYMSFGVDGSPLGRGLDISTVLFSRNHRTLFDILSFIFPRVSFYVPMDCLFFCSARGSIFFLGIMKLGPFGRTFSRAMGYPKS